MRVQNSLPYLRSQIAYTDPGDSSLLTTQLQYHQDLVVSKDWGVDKGAALQLPTVSYSRANSPALGKYFSYELDTQFTNYFRPKGYDPVPPVPVTSGLNVDPNPNFHYGDYLRTGRRLNVEPRLIANIPLPGSLQFQPVFKAGTYLYHFDYPNSSFAHQDYVEAELPLSLYLSRVYRVNFPGAEAIRHVFQPRFVYAQSLYRNPTPSHPFFYADPVTGLSNPRFDIFDQATPYQYFRVELLNRLQKKNSGRPGPPVFPVATVKSI